MNRSQPVQAIDARRGAIAGCRVGTATCRKTGVRETRTVARSRMGFPALFLLGFISWTGVADAYAVPAECIPVMEATSEYLGERHKEGSRRSAYGEERARGRWFERVDAAYGGPRSKVGDVMWQILRAHARRCAAWPWETEGTFWREW